MKHYADLGIAEAFLLVISLYDHGGTVHDVLRHLIALIKLQTLLKVVLLALFYPLILDLRYLGLLAQMDRQPGLVVGGLVHRDLHLAEQTLTPQTLHGLGQLVARYLNPLAGLKTRIAYHDVILIVVGSVHTDLGDLVGARHTVEHHRRIVHSVSRLAYHACGRLTGHERQRREGYEITIYLTQLVHYIHCVIDIGDSM